MRNSCRGKAVLAHPGQYENFQALPALAEAGLWGIEAYHQTQPRGHAEVLGAGTPLSTGCHRRLRLPRRYGEGEFLGEQGVGASPLF